jgi:predicted nucleotidyltransferase component of viral defense system
VRGRLTNQAKASQRPFQEVLQHYGLERLLYRLSQSPHGVRFLLKGALLLKAWGAPGSRPTRDIDLLGHAPNDIALMESMFRDVCQVAVADDGLRFDANTVVGQRIKEDADYQGVRLTFAAFLEKARIPMQIDIGFGDVVNPGAEERDYPTLLDFPAPHLRMYPRETVVAEKFEALVQLGTLNSRMKDFFDLWLLSNQFDFTGVELALAIARTFENRGTALELEPVALTPAFTTSDATQKQWAAFLKRSQLEHAPMTLEEAREPLRRFLLPVAGAILAEQTFTARWVAPGPWGTS